MSKVTMPESDAYIFFGTEKTGDYQHVYLESTMQAYANERVREALEAAAKQPREYAMTLEKNGWGNRFPDELTAIFNAADNMADRIRALINEQ